MPPRTVANGSSAANCGGRRFEPLLVRAARERQEANGRRAAIVLLSHLHHAGKPAADALLFALGDDRYVQDAALEAIERLTFHDDMRESLIHSLDCEALPLLPALRACSP